MAAEGLEAHDARMEGLHRQRQDRNQGNPRRKFSRSRPRPGLRSKNSAGLCRWCRRASGRRDRPRRKWSRPTCASSSRSPRNTPIAASVPGPDPGRQHRAHEGGRQVRIPPRLQVLDLRHLVIRQAITRSIADQARTIRIPVHMIETINKIVRTSRQMLHEIGREPTPEELREKLAMPLEKVRKVLKIAKEPISLETPIGDEEDSHSATSSRTRTRFCRSTRRSSPTCARRRPACWRPSPRAKNGFCGCVSDRHEHRPHVGRSRPAVFRDSRAYPADRGQGAA